MSRILTVVVSVLVVAAVVRLAGREEQRAQRPQTAAAAVDTVATLPAPAAVASPAPFATIPAVAEDPSADLRATLLANAGADLEAKLEELVARIGGDLERALQVVRSLSTETDPNVLFAIVDALARDPRIADAPEMVQAFLEMALRDPLADRRAAALDFLGERPRGEAMEAQFLAVALGDPDSLVRSQAVYSLQRQVQVAPEAGTRLNAALLRAAVSSDACVRTPAVEGISMRAADDNQLSSVVGLLRDDDDVAVRISAAEKLGEVRAAHRDRALRELEGAYTRDADEDVRYTAIFSLVNAGRAEALPVLHRLIGVDPALDPVVGRFAAVLSTGEVDMDTILAEVARIEGEEMPPMTPVSEHAPCCEGHD